jgi:drug/metabolite transporter (DMT)-like permease
VSLPWGVFTLVVLTVIWGSSFVVTKDSLDTVPASLLAALRSGVALLSVFWVKPQKSALLPGLWLGLLASAGFIALMTGLTSTTASKAAFVLALHGLVAPLFSSWVFKHHVPRRAYFAILIALLGLGAMTLTGEGGVNPGDFWCFVGALCFGFYVAYVGEVAGKATPLTLTQVQYSVMSFVMVMWAWPHLSAVPTLSINVWLVVLYLGIVCMSLATVLQVWAQRVVPPYLAALLFILEPVFASMFAFVLLSERLSSLDWVGAALIFAALLVCTLPLKPAPKKVAVVSEVEGKIL